MGVLTDLIIADLKDADGIGREYPSKKYRSVDLKGFDQIKGATLWAILRGDDLGNVDHVVSMSEKFDCLYQGGDDGPWIYKFPDEFLKLLTEVDDDRLDDVTAEWAKTEEFEGFELEDVRYYFDSLYDSAANAEAEGKNILMWISL